MNPSNAFTKQVDVSDGGMAFRIELKKALAAQEILEKDPLFCTPKLNSWDERRGLLFFEKIDNMKPLSYYTEMRWFCRAGKLLALIHSRLRLPEDLTIVRRTDRGEKGVVYVHGDFMPNNLCIFNDKLVVFDWGIRPWNSEIYTVSSPAVDLAAFIAPWWIPRWWNVCFPGLKLRRFLETYFREVGIYSEAADLTRKTLGKELSMLKAYYQEEILKRAPWKRLLPAMKLVINFWKTKVAVCHASTT